MGRNRITLNEDEAIIGGVCAGLADYFDVDPVLVRLLTVLIFFMSAGSVVIAYIIAWIIIPNKKDIKKVKKSKK